MVERYEFKESGHKVHVTGVKLDQGSGAQGQIKSGESTWFGKKITVTTGLGNIELNKGSVIDFLQARGVKGLD